MIGLKFCTINKMPGGIHVGFIHVLVHVLQALTLNGYPPSQSVYTYKNKKGNCKHSEYRITNRVICSVQKKR